MPRGPEFTEEEIPLLYAQDLLNARVIGDSKTPKIPLYDGMIDPYNHLDNFRYAMEGRGTNEATKCHMFLNNSQRLSQELVQKTRPRVHKLFRRA